MKIELLPGTVQFANLPRAACRQHVGGQEALDQVGLALKLLDVVAMIVKGDLPEGVRVEIPFADGTLILDMNAPVFVAIAREGVH